MKNLERYDELSLKLLKIGEALIMEGEEKEDFNILSTGNFITFISSIIYDEEDVKVNVEGKLIEVSAKKRTLEDVKKRQIAEQDVNVAAKYVEELTGVGGKTRSEIKKFVSEIPVIGSLLASGISDNPATALKELTAEYNALINVKNKNPLAFEDSIKSIDKTEPLGAIRSASR
jgi:hypothetical protein